MMFAARVFICGMLLSWGVVEREGIVVAAEAAASLELPARAILSKGPNSFSGEVLEITKGRGSNIGWYIQANQEEQVTVSIEFACAKPLDQEYQISFDGDDRFWEVPVTGKDQWSRAALGKFTVRPGTPLLVVLVPPSNRKYEHPVRFRKLIVEGKTPGNLQLASPPNEPESPDAAPGFGLKLNSLHPALAVRDLRDESQTLRISGMAMRGARELLFTTWDGDLFAVNLETITDGKRPSFRRVAQGLAEPMGLTISKGRIFVTEKNEATELIDEDGDGMFETYRCVSHQWPCSMDYHEYLFGAVVRDEHLYFSSSVGMTVRDKDNRQAPLRGSVVKVQIDSGKTQIVAGGLRTPDGMGFGPNGSILITDNQGEWLPASKLICLQEGAFYQFRSRQPWHPLDRAIATPPAVWLPQGEIANSPTEPFVLPASWGAYAGQVLFGDATYGGLQRAFLEDVEGVTQGAVFHFSQGFRHLFHRFAFSANGDLYAGGIARGQDREFIHRVSGLSQIRYTGKATFEPLAARLRSNGLEIEFTMPLAEGAGWDPDGYFVTQWNYQGLQTYGGIKVRHRRATVKSVSVSPDRRRVFLELPDLVAGDVLYVRLPESLPSADGLSLWTGELWYTINRIPKNAPGEITAAPENTIKDAAPFFRFSEGNAGRLLYRTYCASCHSLDGTKMVGPSFGGLAGSKRKVRDRETNQLHELVADNEYLKQSIVEPNAKLADGYPENLMPPFGASLTEKQVDSLVSYLVKVAKPEFARNEIIQRQKINLAWQMADFPEVGARWNQSGTSKQSAMLGLQAFIKAQCFQCHAVSGYGPNLGPELTETVKKFQGVKLLQQIIEPSHEIHAKFQTKQFVLESGKVIVGVVLKEDDNDYHVASDLRTPNNITRIAKREIDEMKVSQVSAMPVGLLNTLTKSEVLDLLSYLEAGPPPIVQQPPMKKAK